MTIMDSKEWSGWDELYKQNKVGESLQYEKNLVLDVETKIKSLQKGEFLDPGTGSETQAIEFAKKGFKVTGLDISQSAIQKAKGVSNEVNFVTDNILNLKFNDESFDYILDRDCFHVFSEVERTKYLEQIKRVLKKDRMIFLKCMSKKETNLSEDKRPHKFPEADIIEYFGSVFDITKVKETGYYGKIDPLPKALFFVMKEVESLT